MSKWKITLDPVNPQPDLKQFLRAFYRTEDSKLYIRTFSDRGKTEGHNFIKGFDELNRFSIELKKENELYRCISFVVNGGGHNDKDVISSGCCQAQFMEIDDFSFKTQLEMICNFPLMPSIIVRTKKSLHTYWLLIDGDISKFRSLQKRFVDLFGSDSKICNESRAMRIPGFYHSKEEPTMVEVIHFRPDMRYTQEKLIEALDKLTINDLLSNTSLSEDEKANIEKIISEKKKKSKASEAVKSSVDQNERITEHRVDTLISVASKMKHDGYDNSIIRGALIRFNEEKCYPPIDEARMMREVFPALERWDSEVDETEKPMKYYVEIPAMLQKLHPEINNHYKWNDIGSGNLFADVFRSILRWNTTAIQWFFYDSTKWTEDEGGMIAQRCAKDLIRNLTIYAANIKDEDSRNKYLKFITGLNSRRNRTTMLEDAKEKYFLCSDDLDKDDYSINLQNGVLDLKTFELKSHHPNMMLTKICNVSFDPEVPTYNNLWTKTLNEIFEGDQTKIEYLQRVLGYSLTGDTREETCFILYGKSTRNGKSTIIETMSYLMGGEKGYAMNMRPETLAVKHNNDSGRASSDIARLKDCRFLNAAEPPKRMIFDIGLLKTMIGRDTITARYLHQNEFQFTPKFKLFINTNFLPLITDDTLFSSGRINVISFDRHFSEAEQDKTLKDRLKEPESLSAILNWCIDGLKKYYKEGLNPPDSVNGATEEYRASSDKVGCFLEECCVKVPDGIESGKKVYEAYQRWCESNGYGTENKGNFFSDLKSKGLMHNTGYINGVTTHNVLKGYKLDDVEYQCERILRHKKQIV